MERRRRRGFKVIDSSLSHPQKGEGILLAEGEPRDSSKGEIRAPRVHPSRPFCTCNMTESESSKGKQLSNCFVAISTGEDHIFPLRWRAFTCKYFLIMHLRHRARSLRTRNESLSTTSQCAAHVSLQRDFSRGKNLRRSKHVRPKRRVGKKSATKLIKQCEIFERQQQHTRPEKRTTKIYREGL
jgi:hypothetical protein